MRLSALSGRTWEHGMYSNTRLVTSLLFRSLDCTCIATLQTIEARRCVLYGISTAQCLRCSSSMDTAVYFSHADTSLVPVAYSGQEVQHRYAVQTCRECEVLIHQSPMRILARGKIMQHSPVSAALKLVHTEMDVTHHSLGSTASRMGAGCSTPGAEQLPCCSAAQPTYPASEFRADSQG